MQKRLACSHLARQELAGELVMDAEGGYWQRAGLACQILLETDPDHRRAAHLLAESSNPFQTAAEGDEE